jgi:hypothetical protein
MAGRPKARKPFKLQRLAWLAGIIVLAYTSYVLFTSHLRSSVLEARSAQRAEALTACPLDCASAAPTEKQKFRRLAVVRPFIESQMDRLVSSIQQWDAADVFPCTVPAKLASGSDARPVLVLYFNRRSRDHARVRALPERLKQVRHHKPAM